MSTFEILTENRLNTTTLISVASGTDSADNLFDRNPDVPYQSSGFNTNTAGVTIGVTFLSAQPLSRIVLQNINLKDFTVYYNSNPANVITLLNAPTTTSDWSGNSSTSMYLKFDTITVDSIWIVATGTIDASQEKKVGQFWMCDKKFVFENNPTANDYKPKRNVKEVVHEMSDGGSTKYTFGDAFEAKIKLKFQTNAMVQNLEDLFEERSTFVFSPFPTGTSWDGKNIYAVNWIGDFNFLDAAGNNWSSLGWDGEFNIKEVPK